MSFNHCFYNVFCIKIRITDSYVRGDGGGFKNLSFIVTSVILIRLLFEDYCTIKKGFLDKKIRIAWSDDS